MVQHHLEDNGEILSTVLLGDLGRWYRRSLEAADDRPEALRTALALSGLFVRGDEDMRTVIATGFLEALPQVSEDGRHVVEQLPPALRDELHRMETWRPSS
jgi:hypothetical protein